MSNPKRALTIFVAIPFGDQFSEVYNDAIFPLEMKFPDWEINVMRADSKQASEALLWSHITSMIGECDLIIADATGANPNVMLELGVALNSKRCCILITQEPDQLPVNLRGHLHIAYTIQALPLLTKSLAHQIQAIRNDVLKRRAKGKEGSGGRSIWDDQIKPPHRSSLPKAATELRDLGNAAWDRGELSEAADYFLRAIQAVDELQLRLGYWEAKYDRALVVSRLKYEAEAERLAREVCKEATAGSDQVAAYKAHNLLSGIHKRRGEYEEALDQARRAYDISHLPGVTRGEPPHIVPIKNRAALAHLLGNDAEYETLRQELLAHPQVAEVKEELEREIGGNIGE